MKDELENLINTPHHLAVIVFSFRFRFKLTFSLPFFSYLIFFDLLFGSQFIAYARLMLGTFYCYYSAEYVFSFALRCKCYFYDLS